MEINIDLGLLPGTLDRLQNRIVNLRPLLLEIGEDEVLATKLRFSSTTDPDDNLWAVNSAVTLAHKSGSTPLTNFGNFSNSINYDPPGIDSITIGTNADQGRMMQYGGKKNDFPHLWGDIPARPFLGFSHSDIDRIQQLIIDYLD